MSCYPKRNVPESKDLWLPYFSYLTGYIFLCLLSLPACLNAQTLPQSAPPPTKAVVLDRVVAVVNNQAILASDVEDEIRLAVLDPAQAGMVDLTPPRALEQLISRALIHNRFVRRTRRPLSQPRPKSTRGSGRFAQKFRPVFTRTVHLTKDGRPF